VTVDTTAPVPPGSGSGVGPTGPEHPARHDRPAWVRGAVIGGAVACGCAAIALVDPTDTGVPVCWSAGLFGVDCPLCGGLRCVNALVRGDWFAAADHNLVLAVTLPLVVVGWALWMLASVRGKPWRLPSLRPWAWSILAVVVLAFTVVRNLDLGPVAHYLAATAG
jgi:hypothetical protein